MYKESRRSIKRTLVCLGSSGKMHTGVSPMGGLLVLSTFDGRSDRRARWRWPALIPGLILLFVVTGCSKQTRAQSEEILRPFCADDSVVAMQAIIALPGKKDTIQIVELLRYRDEKGEARCTVDVLETGILAESDTEFLSFPAPPRLDTSGAETTKSAKNTTLDACGQGSCECKEVRPIRKKVKQKDTLVGGRVVCKLCEEECP